MNVKALLEDDFKIPVGVQVLILDGIRINDDSKSLKDYNVKQDDVIVVAAKDVGISPAERARNQINNNPNLRKQFLQNNPRLAEALASPELFERVFNEMQKQQKLAEERQRRMQTADEFDVEAQKMIEDEIRKKNIELNFETAMEHNPEFFGRVTMLYIPVEINGVKVKAFVDSGAQATIMSPDCAERCNVMKFLDERFQGMATGVGSAKILGRIHSAQIKVGNQFLPISMSVMEGKDVDLLFGLDVLRRHQACIDLRKNCLLINDEEIRFLSEHELPEKARYFGESAPGLSNENHPILQPSSATEETKTKYSEKTIKLLTDMGIGRSEAIHALDSAGGNPDAAVSLLFQF